MATIKCPKLKLWFPVNGPDATSKSDKTPAWYFMAFDVVPVYIRSLEAFIPIAQTNILQGPHWHLMLSHQPENW